MTQALFESLPQMDYLPAQSVECPKTAPALARLILLVCEPYLLVRLRGGTCGRSDRKAPLGN
eukprot:scaffold2939_cov406-Prasinococcus_capsulatus_cf.AAC.3